MIRAIVNAHIGTFGHMALDAVVSRALFALVHLFMEMVIRGVVGVLSVTLKAEVIALLSELQAVDVVAVAAANSVSIHLRLDKRAVDIDFFEDLTVRVIKAATSG